MVDNSQKILVTGGAGYIGSHIVKQLGEAGYDIVIYDNCSTGSPAAVLYGELIVGDLADTEQLQQVMAQHHFSTVIHLAASTIVSDSVQYPLDYYENNTHNTLNLLRCCESAGIQQLIFSSTAAVYGSPEQVPVSESTPTQPINPYGRSKLMSEWMIQDQAIATKLRYVILRYFNVAGADTSGKVGKISEQEATHLIGAACDVALGRKTEMKIFGTDFPTPDGTAIRDYIHVEDLASAHLEALRYLDNGGISQILNCGYGEGYSVREVIHQVKAISGVDFPAIAAPRRVGDPACVIARAEQIQTVLGWIPKHNDLAVIIQTALSWEAQRDRQAKNNI